MKLKDLKEKITFEKIIYIFWGIYILSLMLSSTSIALSNGTFNTALKIIRYICYIFFSIKVINDWKNGAKITLTFIMMMLLAGIIFISSKNIEIVFTILVKVVDVKQTGVNGTSIGFETINQSVFRFFGVNMVWYHITDWLGIVPILMSMAYALIGLIQLKDNQQYLIYTYDNILNIYF